MTPPIRARRVTPEPDWPDTRTPFTCDQPIYADDGTERNTICRVRIQGGKRAAHAHWCIVHRYVIPPADFDAANPHNHLPTNQVQSTQPTGGTTP